ncbi:MAG: chloride channel protein [Oscillospiraceae bacterium]|nr:chloride channel protein [Oscillospiraceae bacterium]
MQPSKSFSLLPTLLLCLLAIGTGLLTGAITAGFGRILLWIGTVRTAHLLWFLPFLPLAGILMVWVYQKYGKESSQGMSLIFDAANGKADRIPLRLIPLLIGSTWLTHLCGGSAGREGVAVQLGATVAHCTGSRIPVFRRIPDAVRILTISGMAAGFSGLFHAPLAAVCFALEVLAVGKLEYRALLPSALSAVAAYLISTALGLETFQVVLPETTISPLSFQMLLLGIAAGLTGGLFTLLLRLGKQQAAKWLQNPLVRIGVCGVVLAILLYICGNGRYAGLGTNLISLACSGETVYCFDFLCKLLLTVFTLSIGFQGGEVTPLFAIGACLGAVLAPCLGIPTALAAALCYAAVFGSASNTLLAPICIGTEVFGFAYLPYFAVVCTIARLCNGNRSMYGKQTISPLFLTGKE